MKAKRAQLRRLANFVRERELIAVRKASGEPRPWTKDPILATYRFCNVHREDDAVTRHIAKYVREPMQSDSSKLTPAMIMCRFTNKSDTISALLEGGLFGRYTKERFLKVINSIDKPFGPAYLINTAGESIERSEYVARLLDRVWRTGWPLVESYSLWESYAESIRARDGIGLFMAAQVVADVKHAPRFVGTKPDWHQFCWPGPGSRRGANRLCGAPVNTILPREQWHCIVHQARVAILEATGIDLHMQDTQNCLCEFDKYERARLGQGRPKRIYR